MTTGKLPRPRRVWVASASALVALATVIGHAPASRAGVDAFVDHCLADGTDWSRLPDRLAVAGLVEIPPEDGPRLASMPARVSRLWRAATGDAYTGHLIVEMSGASAELCWHVSRPGESATEALGRLQRQFPPLPGTAPRRSAAVFYGGRESWDTAVNGVAVSLAVEWAFLERPSEGVAQLLAVRPPLSRPPP